MNQEYLQPELGPKPANRFLTLLGINPRQLFVKVVAFAGIGASLLSGHVWPMGLAFVVLVVFYESKKKNIAADYFALRGKAPFPLIPPLTAYYPKLFEFALFFSIGIFIYLVIILHLPW
jgi:hypothetical protein